ncbi:hypothetical protein [Glycomyces terrestris]|uniref:hypothetical protein n=1 Tax=Glycomyces terrestris TaxID=2493553 RepID=UPI0013159638|nr:hypothetical protein [Glycomyces terrestris]
MTETPAENEPATEGALSETANVAPAETTGGEAERRGRFERLLADALVEDGELLDRLAT